MDQLRRDYTLEKMEQKKLMERVMDIITEQDLTDFASLCYFLKITGRHACLEVVFLHPDFFDTLLRSLREE